MPVALWKDRCRDCGAEFDANDPESSLFDYRCAVCERERKEHEMRKKESPRG